MTTLTTLELDDLLNEMRERHWAFHYFGLRHDPKAIGAVYDWRTCADVVILRDEEDATAFRVPTFPDTDVFAPEMVSWQYHAAAAWTLRAVLTLPQPGAPGAPIGLLTPAEKCAVPQEWRRPMSVRH